MIICSTVYSPKHPWSLLGSFPEMNPHRHFQTPTHSLRWYSIFWPIPGPHLLTKPVQNPLLIPETSHLLRSSDCAKNCATSLESPSQLQHKAHILLRRSVQRTSDKDTQDVTPQECLVSGGVAIRVSICKLVWLQEIEITAQEMQAPGRTSGRESTVAPYSINI